MLHNEHRKPVLPPMMSKPAPRKPILEDRRSGTDRRKIDMPRPGLLDRRRALDSRKPEVTELEMTNSEWTALSEQPQAPTQSS